MKIMHLSSEYPPTQVFGLGRAVCELAVAQAQLGHDVHVVTNSLGGRDPDLRVDGVEVHRITFPPPPKPPDDTTAVIQFNVLLAQKVAALGRQGLVPDVVHVHDWLTVLAGRAAVHLHPGARLALTIHDTAHGKHFGQLTPPQQYSAFLERYGGAAADLVICCSEHVRQELIQQYHVPAAKIALLPCGVQSSRFTVDVDLPAFTQLFAAPGDRVILYVGRLDAEKGLPTLLEALARVLVVIPEARLVLAGKGVRQAQLQEQARELQFSDRLSFAGYVQDAALAALYQAAAVLAVPSLYEPFGLVALEGMACGKPVVASAVGGLREIVVDGETGLLVPPSNAAALAAALLRVLGEPELAARLGAQGQRRARQVYNWAGIARQTVAAYAPPPGSSAP